MLHRYLFINNPMRGPIISGLPRTSQADFSRDYAAGKATPPSTTIGNVVQLQ
jgi:hypothetical protein